MTTDTSAPRRSPPVSAHGMAAGVLVNHLGVFVASGVGFFLTPYIVHSLGKSSFGIYMLTIAMLNYATLLDFGLGLSVMKLIADRSHEADPTHVRRIVSSVLVLYLAMGTLIVGVGLAAFPLLSGHFHVAAHQQGIFHWAWSMAVLSAGLTFPQSVFTAVITGHRHFALQNRFVIAQSLLSALGTVVLLQRGLGVIGLAVFAFALSVAMFVTKVAVVRGRYGVTLGRRFVDRGVLSTVARFASWVFVINVASKVIFDTDAIVVGALLGPAAVAAYQIALSPGLVLRRFGEQFNVVTLTASSSLRSLGQARAVQRLLLESSRVTALVMLPFVIVFAAWGDQFVRLWVGPGFAGSEVAMVLLSLAMVEIAIQGTAVQVIMAHGRHRVTAIATLAEAVANLTLSILLGRHFGISGVALGTLLPTTVTALGVALPYAARLTGLPFRRLALRVGVPVAEAAALIVLLRLPDLHVQFPNLVLLVLTSGVLMAAFIATNLLALSGERATYLRMLGRVRSATGSA